MQKKEDRTFIFMCENNSYYKIEWKKCFRNLEQLLLMGSAVHLYRKDIKREQSDKIKNTLSSLCHGNQELFSSKPRDGKNQGKCKEQRNSFWKKNLSTKNI